MSGYRITIERVRDGVVVSAATTMAQDEPDANPVPVDRVADAIHGALLSVKSAELESSASEFIGDMDRLTMYAMLIQHESRRLRKMRVITPDPEWDAAVALVKAIVPERFRLI
jgi:hypothetical protein